MPWTQITEPDEEVHTAEKAIQHIGEESENKEYTCKIMCHLCNIEKLLEKLIEIRQGETIKETPEPPENIIAYHERNC